MGTVEPETDRFGQPGQVALDVQHIIGSALSNPAGDVVLTPDGVDGDHGTLDVQSGQQFRNRRDLVAFFSGPDLPQGQSRRGAPRRNRMNRAVPAIARTTHAFAVDGNVLVCQPRAQLPYPTHETRFKLAGVE